MTTEQLVRDHLARATVDVPIGPDVETVVRAGRRRRDRRRTTGSCAALAALVAGSLGGSAVVRHAPDDRRESTVAEGPVAQDYVAGTDVDAVMAAVGAEHLPGLPSPDDVYPSDANHDGPMPDDEFAAATEWQAVYALAGGGRLLVLMTLPVVDPEPYACSDCTGTKVDGGTIYTQSHRTLAPGEELYVDGDQTVEAAGGEVNHGVLFIRDDGSMVSAYERTEPGYRPTLTDDDLVPLVTDERLRFSAGS